MNIKSIRALLIVLSLFTTKVSEASEKILVERYEKWDHPILNVFKRYGILPYKITYSKDGRCPTFYAKFKYPPVDGGPIMNELDEAYNKALEANHFFPYTLIDIKDDMKVNVGWEDDVTIKIDTVKVSDPSTCKARTEPFK